MSFFDWLDAWLTKNFSCWFGSCRCPWKNAKMQEMWRCRRWVGEICGPCCRMVKLISSSRCSSISCCLFYGCWGAFCINHLAIARTKKNTLPYWPSPKVAHLQDQTDEPAFCFHLLDWQMFPQIFRGETRTQGVLAFQILGGHHCWSLFLNYTH